MPLNLPTVGLVSYSVGGNTYTGGPAVFTKSINSEPIKDKANRTVTHVRWTIVVEDVIASTPPQHIDAQMERMRAIFSRSRGIFKYDSNANGTKGFGSFTINSPFGGAKDIMFGPDVKMTVLEQKQYFARVELQFVVNLVPCSDAVPRGVMGANFSVEFDINESGTQKRTFNGTLLVALVPEGRRILDNADNYRLQFIPDTPRGFKRTVPARCVVNDAKNELSIVVVDEEFPSQNIYPPGCVKAKLREEIGNMSSMDFSTSECRLSASYEMAKGADLGLALFHFKQVAVKSFFKKFGNPKNLDVKKLPPGALGGVFPIRSKIVLPDRYDKPIVEIDMSVMMTTSASILLTGNMNEPLPQSNEDLWKVSMEKVKSARGLAGLGLDGDTIFDLCDRFQPNTTLKNKKQQFVPVRNAAIKAIFGETWPAPNPLGSWLAISQGYCIEPEDHVLRHIPLESGESRLRTPALLGDDQYAHMTAMVRGSNPPIYQQQSASALNLITEGFAIRVFYPIPCPTMRSFMGRALIPANTKGFGFQIIEMPRIGPLPVYLARWRQKWMCSDKPFKIAGGWQANPQLNQPPAPIPQLNFGGGLFNVGGQAPPAAPKNVFNGLLGGKLIETLFE